MVAIEQLICAASRHRLTKLPCPAWRPMKLVHPMKVVAPPSKPPTDNAHA
jgi:hypothetical protein